MILDEIGKALDSLYVRYPHEDIRIFVTAQTGHVPRTRRRYRHLKGQECVVLNMNIRVDWAGAEPDSRYERPTFESAPRKSRPLGWEVVVTEDEWDQALAEVRQMGQPYVNPDGDFDVQSLYGVPVVKSRKLK